jgi:hypothetical protein
VPSLDVEQPDSVSEAISTEYINQYAHLLESAPGKEGGVGCGSGFQVQDIHLQTLTQLQNGHCGTLDLEIGELGVAF